VIQPLVHPGLDSSRFLATFDGPARGVRCAPAIVEGTRALGIEVRAGLHTGEVTVDGDDAAGLAVVIVARVGATAMPSEVLVFQTVKDLVAGRGLSFEDAGEHELKVFGPLASLPSYRPDRKGRGAESGTGEPSRHNVRRLCV